MTGSVSDRESEVIKHLASGKHCATRYGQREFQDR